jgi:hypothetical protein
VSRVRKEDGRDVMKEGKGGRGNERTKRERKEQVITGSSIPR